MVNATPLCVMYQGAGALVSSARMYFASTTTSGGVATFYPTTTGTAAGAPLFSSILYAVATPWTNTTSPAAAADATGKAVSADLRTITFNVTVGTAIVVGGVSVAWAPDNTTVNCIVIGS